jgi:hypothetical protein
MHDDEIESLYQLIKEVIEAKKAQNIKPNQIGFRTKAMLENNPEMALKKTKPPKK